MSERHVQMKQCVNRYGCAVLFVDGQQVEHLRREQALALADDLAAILDTDGYVPRHARVAS